ncbi:MAG: CHAT domain-containing protein [Anaerolineae bacterium]
MNRRRYHEFVLQVKETQREPGDTVERYSVYVFLSPAGEGEKDDPVAIPDPSLKIPDYSTLDKRRRQLANRRLDLQEQVDFGRALTKILLPPYARELFDLSLAALNEGEGLRVRLRLPRRLALFPWEYMYLGKDGDPPKASEFMALDGRISIVRHEAIATPLEEPRSGKSRRVLIAMASPGPRQKYKPLVQLPDEQHEIAAALDSMKGIEYTCLPTYREGVDWQSVTGAQREEITDLIQEVKSVDVFHFSGHGDFPEEQSPEFGLYEGEGLIVLADRNNQASPITGAELEGLLGQHGVQLVTLGACKTATRDIFSAWSSVAVALLKGRIPSVVAMQFAVYDDFAALFMATVYKGLVAGDTIDEAVSSGRKAIHGRCHGERAGERDWGAPVLYSRAPSGYIFPPVEDEEARQQAERELGLLSGLHQAWWDWTDRRATVSAEQLRYLAGLGESLRMEPGQALLLLRSAVVAGEPVKPWLDQLRDTGAGLMVKLDDPSAPEGREEATVFQVPDYPKDDRPTDVGRVSWAAVRPTPRSLRDKAAPARVTRHTAALALIALHPAPGAGLARIDAALSGLQWPWQRYARKAELRGALADGDPEIEGANTGLPPWDRFGIWLWRFSRRVFHDWKRILLLALGGGLGAGLGLGLLRALVVLFTLGRKNPASYLLMYGYLGVLLGAVLCLGMLLAAPALLAPMRRWKEKMEPPGFKVQAAAVLLGALFFGLTLAALVGVRGLSVTGRPLVYLLGFVLGLGLSLALYGRPRTDEPLSIGSALLRVSLVAAISAAIQAVFLWVPDTGAALDVALSINFYGAFFDDTIPEAWMNWVVLLDATLAGVVLAVGLSTGLSLANRLWEWLRKLEEEAGG